jgi:hypothetical protein
VGTQSCRGGAMKGKVISIVAVAAAAAFALANGLIVVIC